MVKPSKFIILILAILFAGLSFFVFAQGLPYEEGQIYICPFADSMEKINPRCECRIDLVLGETVTSTCGTTTYEMTLTITEYEGKEYYVILGFENGGAGVNLKPIANAGGPYDGYVGQEIFFDGSKSSDQNEDPLDFYWDFGDGSFGEGENVSHVYQAAGQYTISLTVFDGMASSTATTAAKILSPPPLRRSFIKKEIVEIEKPIQPKIEKPEIQKKEISPAFKIVKPPTSTQPQIQIEKPKIAGVQKIEIEKPLSLLATLVEVFKEKPILPISASISIFSLAIYLFWKIKFLLNASRRR